MSVFKFKNYKSYMKEILGRGMRTQLAASLGCNIGFISQVLGGDSHFSLEHTIQICKFLNLSDKESEFLMLLVQKAKAGSYDLEKHFQAQIEQFLRSREEISERVQKTKALSKEDRVQYFSSSYYALIHMALSIPEFQSPIEIGNKLKVDMLTVNKVLDFLVLKGLVVVENEQYITGPTRLHLEKQSPLITQHHTNTRVEIIKSLSRNNSEDLHYSGVFTMTRETAKEIKSLLLNSIEVADDKVGSSTDEALYIFGMDFFEYS